MSMFNELQQVNKQQKLSIPYHIYPQARWVFLPVMLFIFFIGVGCAYGAILGLVQERPDSMPPGFALFGGAVIIYVVGQLRTRIRVTSEGVELRKYRTKKFMWSEISGFRDASHDKPRTGIGRFFWSLGASYEQRWRVEMALQSQKVLNLTGYIGWYGSELFRYAAIFTEWSEWDNAGPSPFEKSIAANLEGLRKQHS